MAVAEAVQRKLRKGENVRTQTTQEGGAQSSMISSCTDEASIPALPQSSKNGTLNSRARDSGCVNVA